MLGLFDPGAVAKKDQKASAKRVALENIKTWVRELLPEEITQDIDAIAVQEFQCGDPNCSPVDTAIRIMRKEGMETLQAAMPKMMADVTRQDVEQCVNRMIDPEPDEPPLSERAMIAFEGISNDIFTALDGLDFEDKMGICQRLFLAIEDYERLAVQQEMLRRRRATGPDPATIRLLTHAQQNNAAEIQRLISEGQDPSTGNSAGQTALHVASLWGNIAAAEVLIRNGADVNRQNGLNRGTPLHIALCSSKELAGRLECVKMLIAAGASTEIRDGEGLTAVDHAQRRGEQGMLRALGVIEHI